MNELTIPKSWLDKVSVAVGMSSDELLATVNKMWNRGASKVEIEQTMILLAKSNGKTLLFVNSKSKN